MNIVSVYSISESIPLAVHAQLCAVSDALLFRVLLFGVENWFGIANGSFIGDWISINLFTFGLLVGWKPVRKYTDY